jgi:UDP-N-acetylglucosamine--N-acetylmuramyl-(pentapeptide) pyrophosphoryl-undecaprenol N-acetylglucosamine transferase
MIPFRSIFVEGLAGMNIVRKAYSVLSVGVGLAQSLSILFRFRPQVVVGTGGYVSLPPVVAANMLKIPTLIQEQNCVPGRANLSCARFADEVVSNFKECASSFGDRPVHVTGNPIRSDFLPQRLEAIDPEESRLSLGLSPGKFTVFLLGGSRGAHSLNMAMIDALPRLEPQRFQLICMTGTDDYRRVRDACERAGITAAVFQFIDDMVTAYTAADLVLSRAGANTLAEISAIGLPAIFVPYPHSVDRHQELNARAFLDEGAAEMIINGDLNGDMLAERIVTLSEDGDALDRMRAGSRRMGRPDAAEKVVNILFELAFR